MPLGIVRRPGAFERVDASAPWHSWKHHGTRGVQLGLRQVLGAHDATVAHPTVRYAIVTWKRSEPPS